MADITMCINEFCPIKEKCYRYMATPNEFWQSYGEFNFIKTDRETTECDGYISNKHKGNDYEKL